MNSQSETTIRSTRTVAMKATLKVKPIADDEDESVNPDETNAHNDKTTILTKKWLDLMPVDQLVRGTILLKKTFPRAASRCHDP